MNGGSGSSGGSGGRLAVYYNRSFFSGVMSSIGGEGVHLDGAAGTVFLSNVSSGLNTLKVYNRKTSTVIMTAMMIMITDYDLLIIMVIVWLVIMPYDVGRFFVHFLSIHDGFVK